MHRVINYGSFLQAYATQKIIESLEFSCTIINYNFPNALHKKKSKNVLKKFLTDLPISRSQKMKRHFFKFIKKHLNLSTYYSDVKAIQTNPPIFDIYVTGSDQTLNPKHTKNDTTFLLSFAPENKTKIAFSASFSEANLDDSLKSTYVDYLNRYDSVSLREPSAFLQNALNKNIEITLDPTLLIDRNAWIKAFPVKQKQKQKEPYILLYMLSYSFDPTPYIYFLLKCLQQETNLEVLSFSSIPKEYKIRHKNVRGASINDFIDLFDKASYVVTSSFHGTAFSINFGKMLFSVVPDSDTDCRQTSLLKLLDCSNCAIPICTPFENIDFSYNKKLVQEKLQQCRADSIQYLKNNLKEKKYV
jgi:hypothetical protein